MQVTREEINPCTVQLSVVCDSEQVRSGFERAYKDLAKRLRVPGFRPGQAPKAVVRKMVSKEDVYDFAAEHIVRDAYRDALQQEKLEPHAAPAVELKLLDEESAACEFTAKVPLAPKVELGDYKALSAQRPIVEVREEEIDRQVEELRRRKSTRVAITDRGVSEGDVAVVNIRPEDGSTEGRNFMTIAGQTFPQLDEALLGMRVEEMKSLELEFPANFQEADWAGKKLPCTITLRSLSAVQLPELDEEFAKSHHSETVDELRERIRKGLAEAKAAMVDEYVNEQLLEDLVARSKIEVPDNMWEQVFARRMADIEQEQRRKGRSLEEYAAEQGMTTDKLAESLRAEAKNHVVRAVAVQEVFRKEHLRLGHEELNRELALMAREFGMDPKDLLSQLRKNDALDEIHFRAVNRKVLDLLRETARLTEVEIEG